MVRFDEELLDVFNTYYAPVFTYKNLDTSYVREQSRDSFAVLKIDNRDIKDLLEHTDYKKLVGLYYDKHGRIQNSEERLLYPVWFMFTFNVSVIVHSQKTGNLCMLYQFIRKV